ncbi:MAG TPA: enoyl-CoA hydratase/isomerase family protein [Allosphingosinicella sp.]|jgi:enoyl-CoA hydratase/carnithine racemase|nr:enoyl-CoA hydratase/isomerase family protein [Allosphingosinicella sp.]
MFRLEREGEAVRLVLDRPAARNAIPASGWGRLAACLEKVEQLPARVLVLCGGEEAFCAGADLGDFAGFRGDEAACRTFREDMRSALDALAGLALPTVAVIEGACYGAGVALAMACDLRLAAASARFAITPAKLGISYPQEDVHRLVELVGPGQASRLLFTALSIDAGEAARIGLVDLVDGDVEEIVAAIAANDPDSLATLKQAVRLAARGTRSDDGQDRRFDALIGADALTERLEALRRR